MMGGGRGREGAWYYRMPSFGVGRGLRWDVCSTAKRGAAGSINTNINNWVFKT